MKRILTKILLLSLASLLLISLCSCASIKPEDDRIVAKGEGYSFTADEYRYFYQQSKNDLLSSSLTGDELEEKIRENALYAMKKTVAIHTLAEKFDIALDKDAKKEIDEYIQSIRDGFESEGAFEAELDRLYLTEYALEKTMTTQYLLEKLQAYLLDETKISDIEHFVIRADDEALLADIEENFYRGTQILIRNDQGEDPKENEALANEILARLKGGEDFFDLLKEYGEDPGITDKNGYYFTKGQLLPYFEAQIKELAVGEYSGVVECVHGYSIMMRLEKEEAYIKKNLESLRDAMKKRLFDEYLEEAIASVQLETTDVLDTYEIDK